MDYQLGLFSEDKQVKAKKSRRQQDQLEMFGTRETLQFGVNAHPLLPTSPTMKLPMLHEDLDKETDEQRANRMQRQAEQQTAPMFAPPPFDVDEKQQPPQISVNAWYIESKPGRILLVPFETPDEAKASPLWIGLKTVAQPRLVRVALTHID